MKKILLNWRYYVLTLLAFVMFVGIFSEPAEDVQNWCLTMLTSKVIGFGAGYVFYKLLTRWDESGKIAEISAMINEDDV